MDSFQIKLFLCFPDNTNPTNPPGPTENPPTANPTENPPTSNDCDGTSSGNIIRCCRKNGPCNEGKVIVTETVSVLMVWYVAVITAGETFHQKEHYGDEYMIVAMVFI